jgi:hypothetical protein
MRKESCYHSDELRSDRTLPVDWVFRCVLGLRRFFANGFTVLLRIGVLRAGINNNMRTRIKMFGDAAC